MWLVCMPMKFYLLAEVEEALHNWSGQTYSLSTSSLDAWVAINFNYLHILVLSDVTRYYKPTKSRNHTGTLFIAYTIEYLASIQSRLTVVSREAKKKQHAHASSGLRDHYSELFTRMAALKF